MASMLIIGAVAVLVLHSLIHLMGTAVYMRLTTIQGFAYKTTLLGGRLDLGTSGTWWFGLLWLLAGAGTAVAAVGLLAGAAWVWPVLLAATVLSLAICLLDWELAKMGAVVDVVILAAMLLAPQVALAR